ncbi:MAG: transposase [Solirubrobacterales bacterium]|nr:transposase [Solirubrobacterales bacterium]
MEPGRQVQDRPGTPGQGRALVVAQGTRAPEHLAARRAARSQQDQPPPLPRVLLKEQLRLLYHLPDTAAAPAHLDAWLAWASRSKLKPFVKLARTLRARRDGVLAAIRLGLSNGRMEGLNSKVRLLSHRSFGFHGPAPLIALIYLCCSRLTINPPLR